MPTNSANDSSAAHAALAESAVWASVAQRWRQADRQAVWSDLPPIEAIVIPEVDPRDDLEKRARRWSYPLADGDLADLARFAAALAQTEGEAWRAEDRVLATRAFEERRFLAADRVLPWAVPWLRAVARCFPESRSIAEETAVDLLDIGERHRPAPLLTGGEGLFPPGCDSFGPVDVPPDLAARVVTLWGGLVVFRRSLESVTGRSPSSRVVLRPWLDDPDFIDTVATWYEVTAVRWLRLASAFPGTARLWHEMANRAQQTAESAKSMLQNRRLGP